MIITVQKDLGELIEALSGAESVFIVGCSECATICRTGGEEQVQELRGKLEAVGKRVKGSAVLEPACNLNNDRKMLKEHAGELERVEAIVVLACGSGVQTVGEATGKDAVPFLDSVFLAETQRVGKFSEMCIMCGECVVDHYGGHCPIARCPKNMLNGPCGGSKDGMCEVGEHECIWNKIYESLKASGRLQLLEDIAEPKDWSRGEGGRPRQLDLREVNG